MRMKRKMLFSTIGLCLAISLIGLTAAVKAKNQVVTVKVAEVTKGDLKAYLSTTGKVKSQDIKSYYGTQAKIGKINVKVGDSVKKGDILVVYEVQDLNAAVKQAELQYSNAVLQKQELGNQNDDLKSKLESKGKQAAILNDKIASVQNQMDALKKENNVSNLIQLQSLNSQKSVLEQQKSALEEQGNTIKPVSDEKIKEAQNAVDLAALNLNNAKQNLSKGVSNITADQDGVVTAINVEEGAIGNPSQPAIVTQDLRHLKIVVSLGRYDANKISMNQSATISSESKEFKGIVSYIAPVAAVSKTGGTGEAMVEAYINLIEEQPSLKVDFDADVDILLNEVKNTKIIPVESVKRDKSGKSYVYVEQASKVIEKEIKIGIQSDTEVQILEGVQVGERVILNPNDTIENGMKVRVLETHKNK